MRIVQVRDTSSVCLTFLLFAACLVAATSRMAGQETILSAPLPSDRARIRVVEIPDALDPARTLKVLRTDANSPLRAGTAWIWSQQPQEPPASYYKDLRDAGINAVRLILFDVWIHEKGWVKYDWKDPEYRRAMLARLQRAVDHCSRNGLYAIINAHNRVPGPHPKYDDKLNTDLWSAVAPTFANRTHVAFELSNEAITGPGRDGALGGEAQSTLEALARVYAVARRHAPTTHIMVLTPAGVSGWGTRSAMSNLTRSFEKLAGGIDWTRTSVAYHLYHADEALFPQMENLRAFHQDFPAWPSENNFPPGFPANVLGIEESDRERSVSFGSDVFVMQTCERLGIGWCQWHINGPEQFRRNWPILWTDAIEKGYAWDSDP